jgi:hypothetical protein
LRAKAPRFHPGHLKSDRHLIKAAGLGDLLKKLGFSGTKCHANSLARRARSAEPSRVSALHLHSRHFRGAKYQSRLQLRLHPHALGGCDFALRHRRGRCTRRHHANALKRPERSRRTRIILARVLGADKLCLLIAGWSSLVARQAHNLKVVGSNPTPATKFFVPIELSGLRARERRWQILHRDFR